MTRSTTAAGGGAHWSRLRGGADRLALGCDYNPEQWPREVWPEDVALMREAGLTFVTLGVFSWSLLEPEEGRFDLDWLAEVMDLLHDGGIAVDLATGTASPPPWLATAYPQVLPVDREGRTRWPGGRQHWCPSSALFTEKATALTAAMAARFADHPALAMWHVSNEYGCHHAPCYCDTCAVAFRTWLERRYGDVAALGEAWGTAFWSQRHTSFAQVLPPRLAPTPSNPAQVLDYARFTSDALLAQYLAEKEVLGRLSPGVPVTTNFMTHSHFRHLDYHRWAPHQDVVSTDHYLVARQEQPEAELAFSGDLTRGLASGRPWLLMEHSTSAVNWQPVNPAKDPGQMLRNAVSHLAHGADGLAFFQWRASRAGSEKYHSALLPHAGTDTRIWRDVLALGALLGRAGAVAGTRVEADVALLWDYEAGWALDQPNQPSTRMRYGDDAHALHAALLDLGIATDVVHPDADLTAYRLIVVPTLHLCTDASAANVAGAAAGGAHVLVTCWSGIVDEHDRVRLGGYPGAFRELLGVRVEEVWPLLPGEHRTLDDGATATVWSEDVGLEGAEATATFADGPLAGRAAVTRRPGAGAAGAAGDAWYLATRLHGAALSRLVERIATAAGVTAPVAAPVGVERVRRRGPQGSFLFLTNRTADTLTVDATGHDLVTDTPADGALALAPGAVAVLIEPETPA
ncbi:MAG TPA: beta-galactosidase [Dermatophilaceae bacterium]|nr:beta-galactosidase [Dermatophilaceae bacterium]